MTTLPFTIMCDICGKMIAPDQTFIEFRIYLGLTFGEPCNCHDGECERSFREAQESADWRKLPQGPLRMLYEQASR